MTFDIAPSCGSVFRAVGVSGIVYTVHQQDWHTKIGSINKHPKGLQYPYAPPQVESVKFMDISYVVAKYFDIDIC